MTELLKLVSGDLVPMSAVKVLRPVQHEGGFRVYLVLARDGERLGEVRDRDLDEVRGHVVPAAPGWRVAYLPLLTDEGDFELFFEPIVAWRVEGDNAKPVTVEGDMLDHDYAIVAPDGYVTKPYSGSWPTLAEATEAMGSIWRSTRKRREETSP